MCLDLTWVRWPIYSDGHEQLEMKAEPKNADACLGPQGLFPDWYAAAPCSIELEVSHKSFYQNLNEEQPAAKMNEIFPYSFTF